MPLLHVLAGPNGAGKSTLYRTLVEPRFPGLPLVRADECLDLLAQGQAIAVEAAFREPSNLQLLVQAREQGFGIALYVLCVDDPRLLQRRAPQVLPHKVITDYSRTLALLQDALALADLSRLFDGADVAPGGPALVVSITATRMHLHTALRPRWVEKLLGFAER
jgi:predicted ABC-type ATPase